MSKQTKTIIIIAVAIVLIYGAYRAYKFSSNPFGTVEADSENKQNVSLSDIMAKGYSETEARQILASIEAGKTVSY